MEAHATQTISSGFGTFLPGDSLEGVPDDTVDAWIEARIAASGLSEYPAEAGDTEPSDETGHPEPGAAEKPETATAPSDETATQPGRSNARPRRNPPAKPRTRRS